MSSDPEVSGRIVSKRALHEKRAWHDGEPGGADGKASLSFAVAYGVDFVFIYTFIFHSILTFFVYM